jgi:hypothetical protein
VVRVVQVPRGLRVRLEQLAHVVIQEHKDLPEQLVLQGLRVLKVM